MLGTTPHQPGYEWIGEGLRLLESYLLDAGEYTYFLNSLRREFSLCLRTNEPYESVFSNENAVYFHNVDKKFGEFSNYSDHPIFCDGIIWRTVEHYYQAQKFSDHKIIDLIRAAQSPVIAKEIATLNKECINDNWDTSKKQVMRKAVRAKFMQHPELKSLLLSTNAKQLVEFSANDNYWGDPGDGSGQNNLGKILMTLRDQLKS